MKTLRRIVVLGASEKPDRYSHQAVKSLISKGYEAVPVSPKGGVIAGLEVLKDLGQVESPVDTLTLYVSAKISSSLKAAILRLAPARVIFNPGAENPELKAELEAEGIETEEACTLVLLGTGQF